MTREKKCLLLPNLGAEEGDDWRGYLRQPATRIAARLWAHLFACDAIFRTPTAQPGKDGATFVDEPTAAIWPGALGDLARKPAYPWLQKSGRVVPWLATPTLEQSVEITGANAILGPGSEIVSHVHDKAFALEAGRELDLIPNDLVATIEKLDPEDMADPDRVIERLEGCLNQWPEWTLRRFTLKPRFGSSGRGRVAGVNEIDTPAVRGALPRLRERGGAILEPWLERRTDLSVCLYLPEVDGGDTDQGAPLPTLLGSLEMLATQSGVYRGHCGEFDHRGRVFSGHPDDESLRADAASLASAALRAGYFGPCGIDAFTYVRPDDTEREFMRAAVELNARATMGLVTLGLLRRVLPSRKRRLGLKPGERRAFLFALLDQDAEQTANRITDIADGQVPPLMLGSRDAESSTPTPYLFFASDLDRLRQAYRECTDG